MLLSIVCSMLAVDKLHLYSSSLHLTLLLTLHKQREDRLSFYTLFLLHFESDSNLYSIGLRKLSSWIREWIVCVSFQLPMFSGWWKPIWPQLVWVSSGENKRNETVLIWRWFFINSSMHVLWMFASQSNWSCIQFCLTNSNQKISKQRSEIKTAHIQWGEKLPRWSERRSKVQNEAPIWFIVVKWVFIPFRVFLLKLAHSSNSLAMWMCMREQCTQTSHNRTALKTRKTETCHCRHFVTHNTANQSTLDW